MIKKILKNTNIIFMIIFLLVSIFTPKDYYSIKKTTFFIIISINLPIYMMKSYSKNDLFILFYGIGYPILTILLSILITNNITTSFIMGYPPMMLLLYFIIKWYNINFELILEKILMLLALTILCLVILDQLSLINLDFIMGTLHSIGSGSFGKNRIFSFYYKLFFSASPLLVIIFFKYYYEKKWGRFFLVILSLVFSGTRANLIFPIITLGIMYFMNKRNLVLKKCVLLILIFIGGILLYDTFERNIIEKNQISDNRRINHLIGYEKILENETISIFVGKGFGAEFHTDAYEKNGVTYGTEFSHLELIRQNGIVLFIIFSFFLITPFFYLKRTNDDYFLYAYMTYHIIAFTNPLLYNSTGFIMLIYIYYIINIKKGKNNNEFSNRRIGSKYFSSTL